MNARLNRKGSALFLGIFVLTVVSGLTLVVLASVSSQARSSAWNMKTSRAYYAAEAGTAAMLAQINSRGIQEEDYDTTVATVKARVKAAARTEPSRRP